MQECACREPASAGCRASTAPVCTVRYGVTDSAQAFQQADRAADVLDLLRAGDLPLDGDGARVADLLQLRHVAIDADLALAEWLLLAQLAGPRRPGAVLSVRAEDIPPQEAERFDRLAGAVQQHVRGVEVHAQVVAA